MMDLQTVAIGVGLVVSLLFTEIFGLSVGGMIVPGYVALSLHDPATVAVTLGVALATYAVVLSISKFAIVYGRRRIVLMILVGFVIGALARTIPAAPLGVGTSTDAAPQFLCVIGFIIPGLIALWMDRQGMIETLAPLMTSSVMVRLVLILLGMEILA